MEDIHVLPIGDLREHEEMRDCWCAPRLIQEDEGVVVVHFALDGRDLIEQHGIN